MIIIPDYHTRNNINYHQRVGKIIEIKKLTNNNKHVKYSEQLPMEQ